MRSFQNKIYEQSATTLAEVIEKPIVDVVVTSPPYADLKDYGVNGQIGFGQQYETEYLPALKDVFEQCFLVSKPTASMWVIADTFKKSREVKLLPFDIARICKEAGWILTDVIIWDKGKTLPWSHRGQLRNMFEYICFFTKSKRHKYYVERIKDPVELKEWWVKYPERYSFGGKNPSNIWRIPIPVQGSWSPNGFRHSCPFPPELVERILLLTTNKGDTVLDPFAGSGVVLAQALCMERKYIGFEVNGKYVSQFKKAVIPALQQKWTQTQEEMLQLELRRKEFEGKIQKLRILKYPKSMFKQIRKTDVKATDSIGLIVIDSVTALGRRSEKFACLDLTLVVNDSAYVDRLKKGVESAQSKPPLSKFGLKANVHVKLATDFMPSLAVNNKTVYVYMGSRAGSLQAC